MRGEPCSPAWRLTALLLGASWVVTLAVACGGGGDGVVATPATVGAVGSASRGDAGERALASAAGQVPQARSPSATSLPTASVQPCTEASRQVVQRAALPTQLRPPEVQAHELSDEALNLPTGRPGTGAAHTQMADLVEAKQ